MKAPRLRQVAARIAGLATPGAKRKCPPTPRKKHADLKKPDRWRMVMAYLELCKGKDRLPRRAMETLKKRFLHLNLNAKTVQRTVDLSKKQAEEDATSRNVRTTRRHASVCGGQGMILTTELAAKLVEINDKNWGNLSCKKFAGKLTAGGFPCSVASCIDGANCLMQHVDGGTSSPNLPLSIVLVVFPGCSASTKSGGRSSWTTTTWRTVMRNSFI